MLGCSAQPPQQLSCSDVELRCYRGNSIDPRATQERYGSEGAVRLFQDQY
jgi:hypothetical protein